MASQNSVLIVAGEASADLHGAKVLEELTQRRPDLRVFGIGGELMRAQGLEPVARAEDISVAGLTEVLFAIPRIFGILKRLENLAKERRPKVAVLIDLPDFNLRLAARLKALGIPVVYYISPQVWAWRQKRVHEIRRVVDRMLVILPFEQAFYERHGVAAEFVGHPLVEELPAEPQKDAARRELGLGGGPVVALLPGSRHKEVTRHLPLMLEGLKKLRETDPSVTAVIPVASTVPRALVEQAVAAAHTDAKVVDGHATEVLCAADAAVVCSGTATLQTALLYVPMVVVYRVSWLTFRILKALVKVAHIALVNLIAEKALVTELVQDAFTAERVRDEIVRLLDKQKAHELTQAFRGIRAQLGAHGAAARVAEVVAEYAPAEPNTGALAHA